MNRPWREFLLLGLILGLTFCVRWGALRITFSIDPHRLLQPDSFTYEGPARAIVQTGRFSASPERLDVPEVMRTPGYPFFIAGVYYLFGIPLSTLTRESEGFSDDIL